MVRSVFRLSATVLSASSQQLSPLDLRQQVAFDRPVLASESLTPHSSPLRTTEHERESPGLRTPGSRYPELSAMLRPAVASGSTRRRKVYEARRGEPSARGGANLRSSKYMVNCRPRNRKLRSRPYSGYGVSYLGVLSQTFFRGCTRLTGSALPPGDFSQLRRAQPASSGSPGHPNVQASAANRAT
jgi:hypothetical protein